MESKSAKNICAFPNPPERNQGSKIKDETERGFKRSGLFQVHGPYGRTKPIRTPWFFDLEYALSTMPDLKIISQHNLMSKTKKSGNSYYLP